MCLLQQYQAIIFDFDGVILDAVQVRTEAFLHVLKEYPKDALKAFREYHLANGGVSRFAKIRYFFDTLLQAPLSKEQEDRIFKDFASFIKQNLYDKSLLIPQTLDFIKTCHQHNTPMFIASGSEQQELRSLCEFLEIHQYFQEILGSPTPKTQNVATLIKDFSLTPHHTVLIGDSPNDCVSAHENGIDFLGFNNDRISSLGQGYIQSFHPLCINKH